MPPQQPVENQASNQQPQYANPVAGGEPFMPSTPNPWPNASNIAPPSASYMPTVQPNPMSQKNIKSYRIPAILVAVFCSLPLGAVALVYSSKVDAKQEAGDIAAAQKASKTARMWVIIGVVIGLPLTIFYIARHLHS